MSHAPQHPWTPAPSKPVAWKEALWGSLAAIVAAPFAAAIVATLYRFPVPLSDYVYGLPGAPAAAIGSLFYLLLGGAFVLGILGAAGSYLTARFSRDPRQARVLTLAVGLIVALLGAVSLAVLELFVGAW
ncbi:hypothetical protein [Nocardia crassostreae]|uniref:hypothetical protein n=1 Tax=Nocardia crassostreae TaxID=53428 RepID=UPI000836B4A0|nr:hypothetical protein [Nocardia crassostreae]